MKSSCGSFEKCCSDVRIDRRKNQRSLLINSGLSVFIRYISCKDIPNFCKVARNEAKMYCLLGTEWLEVSAIAERLLLYNKLLYKDLTCDNSLHLYYLISDIAVVDKMQELLAAKLIYARHHRDTSFIDFPQSIRHLELATEFTLNSLIAERNLEYNLSKLWITGANYFGLNYNSPKLVSNSKINCCYVKSIPDYFVEKSNGERLGWNLNISEVPVTSVYYNNMQRSYRVLEAALILKVNETDPAWYPMLRAMKCEYNSLHYCYLAEVTTPQDIEKETLLNTAAATMQQASVIYLCVYDNPMSEISLHEADGLMSDALALYAAIDDILPILKERIEHASVIIEQCISMEPSSKVVMLWKYVRQEYIVFLTENNERMDTLLKAKSRSQIHNLRSVITSIPPNIQQLKVILPTVLYFEQLIVRQGLYVQTLVETEPVDGCVDIGEYKLLLQDCRRKALYSIEKAVEIYQTALSTADYSTVVFEQIQLRAESYEKRAIYYSKLATCLLLPSSSYLLESRCAKSSQETEMWLRAQTYLYEGVRHGIHELDTLTTDINTSLKDITFSPLVSSFEHRASYCINAAKYLRRRHLLPEDSDMSLLLALSAKALQLNIEYWGINNCELALWPICKYYGYIELTKTMLTFCDRADDIHPLLHSFCLCVEKGLNSSLNVEISAWYKAARYIVDALTNNCVSLFWGLTGLSESICNEMKAYCAASEANAVTNDLLFETVIFTKISKLQREIERGMLYDDNSEYTLYLNILLVEHAERHGCTMTSIMPKPQIATKLAHSSDRVEKVQAIFVEAQCAVAQTASAYKHKWKKVISWAAKVSKQCSSPHFLSMKQARDAQIHAMKALEIYGPYSFISLLWRLRADLELQLPLSDLYATVREVFFQVLRIWSPSNDTSTGNDTTVLQLLISMKTKAEKYHTAVCTVVTVSNKRKHQRKETKKALLLLKTAILNVLLYASDLHGHTESSALLNSAVTAINQARQMINPLFLASNRREKRLCLSQLKKAEMTAAELQERAVAAAHTPSTTTILSPADAPSTAEVDFEQELQNLFDDPVKHATQMPATPLFLPKPH